MRDDEPGPDGPPPVPGLEIFDELEPAAVAPVEPASEGQREPEPAHPVLRAFAFLLDGFATFVLTVVAVFAGLSLVGDAAFSAILAVPVLAAALATTLTALVGFTPAKALLGLRVVDAVTGGRPGWRAVPRGLVIVAPLLIDLVFARTLGGLIDSDIGLTAFVLLPPVIWVVLLAVLVARRNDRYRGVQDLAARSVVVRVR